MTAVSATTARSNLRTVIDQLNEELQPQTVTCQRPNAVLIGEDGWSAIRDGERLLFEGREDNMGAQASTCRPDCRDRPAARYYRDASAAVVLERAVGAG